MTPIHLILQYATPTTLAALIVDLDDPGGEHRHDRFFLIRELRRHLDCLVGPGEASALISAECQQPDREARA